MRSEIWRRSLKHHLIHNSFLIKVGWYIENDLDLENSPPTHVKCFLKNIAHDYDCSLAKFPNQMIYSSKNVMHCAIWYILCNLKSGKNTHAGVLHLEKFHSSISVFSLF